MTDQLPSGAHERPSPPAELPTSTDAPALAGITDAFDAPAEHAQGDELATADAGPGGEATARPRRRRRGGRRRRGRGNAPAGELADAKPEPQFHDDVIGADEPALDVEPPSEPPSPAHATPPGSGDRPARGRRGRRRRRGPRRDGGDVTQPIDAGEHGAVVDELAAAVEAPVDATVEAIDAFATARLGARELPVLDPDLRDVPQDEPGAAAADTDDRRQLEPELGGRKRRRRRGRRGRGRAGQADRPLADAAPLEPSTEGEPRAQEAPAVLAPEREPDSADAGGRRRRRRGGRGRRRVPQTSGPVAVELIPGEDDDLQPLAVAAEVAEDEGRPGDEFDQEAPRIRPGRKNVILVNSADREETRVAVVVDEQIVDFLMHVKRHEMLVNDIYRGKVVNLEPAIGAAFVDFGQGRNGFLHTSDVLSAYGDEDWSLDKLLTTKIDPDEWDEKSGHPEVGVEVEEGEPAAEAAPVKPEKPRERHHGPGRHRARPRLPITDLLDKGQSVVVQVTKDAIGDKGPTLTTYISIPGRYLVLMPSMARTGVSRKIEDDKERRRLKRILESLEIPQGMGVIVRTAGVGCTRAEIQRDLDYLLLLWADFSKRLDIGRGPVALYEESDVAIRTVRDLFNDHTQAVIVDDERVYNRVRDFVTKLMPEKLDLVQLHTGLKPLFHTYNVEQDFERIFARRIDLKSGGSIVFDQAEALVAIDVNSGKTRTDGFDFEEVALRTNLDAVDEIARQIRLRDLGGIIVIDFIDMLRGSARKQVERALRDALVTDRARSKLGRISQFGLLELTRQRLGPGLSKMLFHNCPRCRGSGKLRTVESRTGAILRRLGSALTLKGFSKVEVRTQPEVVEHLKRNYGQELRDLGLKHEREIELIPVTEQVEDSVLRYLRTDGREVRPGGRRKR